MPTTHTNMPLCQNMQPPRNATTQSVRMAGAGTQYVRMPTAITQPSRMASATSQSGGIACATTQSGRMTSATTQSGRMACATMNLPIRPASAVLPLNKVYARHPSQQNTQQKSEFFSVSNN